MDKTLPVHFNKQKTLLPIMLISGLLGNLMAYPRASKTFSATPLLGTTSSVNDQSKITLNEFVTLVANGRKEAVVGIFIPGQLALPVGQQPKGNAGYVTREQHQATQFNMANQFGSIGILAHNDLAGENFPRIRKNQSVVVVYGDGRLESYVVGEILKYQALSPTSAYSDFIKLDGSKELLTASQLFKRIYGQGDRLVLQTCIAAYGESSWGRLFIIARPANKQTFPTIQDTSILLEGSSIGIAA